MAIKRSPMPGFPKHGQFETMERVKKYLGHEKLTCLICGYEFRGLQQHIDHAHEMSAEQYKREFGLPLSIGLVGTETIRLKADAARARVALMPQDEQKQLIEKMHAGQKRAGCVVSHSPAVNNQRKKNALLMSQSEKHISKTTAGMKAKAPCSKCGTDITLSALAALTKACSIQCEVCKRKAATQYSLAWATENREKRHSYQRVHRKKMQETAPEQVKANSKRYHIASLARRDAAIKQSAQPDCAVCQGVGWHGRLTPVRLIQEGITLKPRRVRCIVCSVQP